MNLGRWVVRIREARNWLRKRPVEHFDISDLELSCSAVTVKVKYDAKLSVQWKIGSFETETPFPEALL
jgi:hypothetical protein